MFKQAFTKLRFLTLRNFSEVVAPKTDTVILKPNTVDTISDISKQNLGLTPEEFQRSRAMGVDIFLSPEKKQLIQTASFFFRDNNEGINLEAAAHEGWKLTYLKNMNLLFEYNTIFRDFLQSCARFDDNGLKLCCEPTLHTLMQRSLNGIKKQGYQLEIESLRTIFDYSMLRIELYKNLNINRSMNMSYDSYSFSQISTPLGPLVTARENNKDNNSLAKNPKPFILAATMLIKTPMKVAIFNQNMSRKIYGEAEAESLDYVVRFETEMNYSDFTWVLPSPNKPSRLRATKITDFNNVARGNPYFYKNKWDLVDEAERFNYMAKDKAKDVQAYMALDLLDRFK
jgi:hypothetical protein